LMGSCCDHGRLRIENFTILLGNTVRPCGAQRRLFVVPHAHLDDFVVQRFDISHGWLRGTLKLPRRHVSEVLVVTFAFTVWILVLLTEMAAATLLPRERVETHELAQFDEIGHAARLLERLVERISRTRNFDARP